MYIDLIELLRCPEPHDESWLVAAFDRVEDRFVLDGRLGCPVCGAEYRLKDGVAEFNQHTGMSDVARNPTEHSGERTVSDQAQISYTDPQNAVRIAAMLGLVRAGMLVVLAGVPAETAAAVSDLTLARVIVVNPPLRTRKRHPDVAEIRCGARLPVARRSADGMMLDGVFTEPLLGESDRVLRPGGRLALPAATELPARARELARDEHYVVGQMEPELVSLSRVSKGPQPDHGSA